MSQDLPYPTRKGSVEGREVVVYDNLLGQPELAQLSAKLQAGKFSRTEYARDETIDFKHWVMDFELRDIVRLPIHRLSLMAIDRHFGPGHKAFRSYCNVALYGDQLMTHTDCNPTDMVVTALWYICPEWNLEWGGETLFFNDQGDAIVAVTPKPGRLVIFDGAIVHVGRPPNRIATQTRYTFAIKFIRKAR